MVLISSAIIYTAREQLACSKLCHVQFIQFALGAFIALFSRHMQHNIKIPYKNVGSEGIEEAAGGDGCMLNQPCNPSSMWGLLLYAPAMVHSFTNFLASNHSFVLQGW